MATNGGGQLHIGRNSHHASRNGGENLARILGEMSRPGINLERRRDGDRSLRDYVEAEARDLSGQPFNRFMTSLYGTIQSHISRFVMQAWLMTACFSPDMSRLCVVAALIKMKGSVVFCLWTS